MVGTQKKKGILLRLLDIIFENLSGTSRKKRKSIENEYAELQTANRDISLSVSICEIYNEKIQDLLDKGMQKVVREDNGRIIIKDLVEQPLTSPKDAQEVIQRGLGKRTISSTSMNADSSRSHTITTFHLKSSVFSSSLAICDLAGSERTRLKEASTINASLMTFGRCLESIRKQEKVPFRDSKLTTVLQPYFTSKSKLSAIINISPCASDCKETTHVLEFSAVASEITTTARVNTRLNTPAKSHEQTTSSHERTSVLEMECKKLNVALEEKEKEMEHWKQKARELEAEVLQLKLQLANENEKFDPPVIPEDLLIPSSMKFDESFEQTVEPREEKEPQEETQPPIATPSTPSEKKKSFFKNIIRSPKGKKTPTKSSEVVTPTGSSPLSDRTNHAHLTIEDILKGDFGLSKSGATSVVASPHTTQIAKRYLFK